MKVITRIPHKVLTFKEGTKPKERVTKNLFYGWEKEENKVVCWVRYPSYDFIFAIPTKNNKYYKQEHCLFAIRHSKNNKIMQALYFDKGEFNEIFNGFKLIKKHYLKGGKK